MCAGRWRSTIVLSNYPTPTIPNSSYVDVPSAGTHPHVIVMMMVVMMVKHFITNYIRGEKIVMWRNFSFPCMTIVGKLKISKFNIFTIDLRVTLSIIVVAGVYALLLIFL